MSTDTELYQIIEAAFVAGCLVGTLVTASVALMWRNRGRKPVEQALSTSAEVPGPPPMERYEREIVEIMERMK